MFKPKSDPAAPSLAPADAVQQARTRARQRLIGAVVLLGIGIVGFPLVFETQPRPIPVDIPIEIPKKDALPPLVTPPAMSAASRPEAAVPLATAGRDAIITESKVDAGRDVTPAASAVTARPASQALSSVSPAKPTTVAPPFVTTTAPPVVTATAPAVATATATPAETPTATAAAMSTKPVEAPAAEAARARALLEGKPVAAAAADASRYVVQVGAFADANAARETRLKVEKLGLRTYTQIAQTPDGSRIRVRVGPFGSRSEADAALAKAKSAGLSAVVLTL